MTPRRVPLHFLLVVLEFRISHLSTPSLWSLFLCGGWSPMSFVCTGPSVFPASFIEEFGLPALFHWLPWSKLSSIEMPGWTLGSLFCPMVSESVFVSLKAVLSISFMVDFKVGHCGLQLCTFYSRLLQFFGGILWYYLWILRFFFQFLWKFYGCHTASVGCFE